MLPYQYVVLRCVPRVDREEFLNVGVVLYCQAADYLECAGQLPDARLRAFAPDLDLDTVRSAVTAVSRVCAGSGPSRSSSLGQRFGWLAAPKSTIIQPGPVHGGLTTDPAVELAHLADTLVR